MDLNDDDDDEVESQRTSKTETGKDDVSSHPVDNEMFMKQAIPKLLAPLSNKRTSSMNLHVKKPVSVLSVLIHEKSGTENQFSEYSIFVSDDLIIIILDIIFFI